jgi:PAS domain S-box-containing protein
MDHMSKEPTSSSRPEMDRWRGAMLENALDAVVGLDSELRVIDWNQRAELAFGWPRESATGQHFPEAFFPPGERAAGRARLRAFFAEEGSHPAARRYTAPALRRDGEIFSAELTATPLPLAGGHLLYLFIRTLGPAALAGSPFEFSEEKFRVHFEQAAYSIQLLSPEGRTLAVNRAWRELWGIPDEFIRDYIFAEYNVRRDPQLAARGIAPFIEDGFSGKPTEIPPILYDPRELGAAGKARWVSGFIYPVKDRAGRITEVVLTHQDVTRAKLAEDELLRSRDQLREAVNARDEFISICSHELKTPVTSMKLQFQLAAKQLAKGDPSAYAAEMVQKRTRIANEQLTRMAHLIEEMLDVSRISAGQLQLTQEAVDLNALAEEVVERFKEQFEESNTSLRFSANSQLGAVYGDRYRLEQVLSNLLGNALKYGAGKPVAVSLAAENGLLRLTVADAGIGIAPENLERIFGRFERAVPYTNITGLGLGLFISRRIVEAHGGRIWVESSAGQGATFVVELPRT